MNPFGTYNPTQFSATNPINVDTGTPWGYIRIINNSPYLLTVTFGNQGSISFPEMFLEDVPMSKEYNGKISIVPIQNIALANINSSLSSLITINAYRPGELDHPQAQPLGTPAGIGKAGQTLDAILEAFPSVDITVSTFQTFALTPQFLNIAGVSSQNPGYLILGYFDCDMGRKVFIYTRGNNEQLFLNQTITVPAGVTGNLQTFTLPQANGLTGINIYTLPAGVTIGDIAIKRAGDPVGNLESVVPGTQAGNMLVNLQNFFGPDGFTNYKGNAGLDVRFSSNNSNGAPANYSVSIYGYQLGYDEAEVQVSYTDWENNQYDLGTGRIGQNLLLPLNFLVPIPITNPAQTNFGSVTFQCAPSQSFYNTHYTFDTYIPCIVTQLAE